jgi:phosphatidyl-myo-inositol dimannoside synthase
MPEVLVVTPDFPPEVGGIQTLAYRLVCAFTRYRPYVVAPSMAGAGAFDDSLPVPVRRAGSTNGRHGRRIVSLNVVGFQEAIRRRPDAILSMHVVSGASALAAGRLLRRPVVLYAHAQELTVRRRLAGQLLRRSDAVIAVSRYTATMVQRLGAGANRVHVVHPGVDAPKTHPPAHSETERGVIVVARLEERYKGHDVLVRAMPLVRTRVPHVHLHVVGDGVLRPELEALAERLGIGQLTTFHGTVTDAERDDLLCRASVFAMPSRLDEGGAGEGFGIAYVEAAAHGLPSVAGRVGGATDAVVDRETGLLVDPEDPAAVADAISTLLLDTETTRRMGAAAWERARTLSWMRSAAEVEAVLDEVTCA